MLFTARSIFLVLALVSFVLATLGVKGPAGGWVPVGLFFLTLSFWPGLE